MISPKTKKKIFCKKIRVTGSPLLHCREEYQQTFVNVVRDVKPPTQANSVTKPITIPSTQNVSWFFYFVNDLVKSVSLPLPEPWEQSSNRLEQGAPPSTSWQPEWVTLKRSLQSSPDDPRMRISPKRRRKLPQHAAQPRSQSPKKKSENRLGFPLDAAVCWSGYVGDTHELNLIKVNSAEQHHVGGGEVV